MDKINSLPDECLVSIISFLPTKVAVSTSVLSKRWECLWMWLPKLEYNDSMQYTKSESEKLRSFLHRSLALHKAQVMEKLSLKFSSTRVKPEDVNLWVVVAASRCIRELEISYYPYYLDNPIILPSSLYTRKSLVVLKLKGEIIVEVPCNVCLPSLKTLQLERLTYACGESLQRLLSICPILEDLLVELRWGNIDYQMKKFTIIVPSLQRLTLLITGSDVQGLVINTPSLEYFKLDDRIPKRHYYMVENMPKLLEAYVDVFFPDVKNLIGSVKRLTLCLQNLDSEEQDMYGASFVFNKLEHLKICVCKKYSLNLVFRLLKDSPNLRILELFRMECHTCYITRYWNLPTMVPECLLSSLQIFNWSTYLGSPAERNLAVYILENASHLKTATISFSERSSVPKLEMIKELKLSSRASSTCQLVFD